MNPVIAVLRERLASRTQAELAKDLAITPQYLSDVLNGRREPGPKILRGLRLRRVVSYESARGTRE